MHHALQRLPRARILLPLLAAAVAGCATPLHPSSPAGAAPAAASPPAGPRARTEPTPARRASYRCDDGQAVELRFFPQQGTAVLVREGRPVELQQQPAASGFAYGTAPLAVRGRGDQLSIDLGRRVPVTCVAVG